MIRDIETYQDLFDALAAMTPEQRAQPVQTAKSPCTEDKPVELYCAVAIGTVGEFEFRGTRSIVDNKYHADEVVLLVDVNPFAQGGAIAYEMFDEDRPLYGRGGLTRREDQFAPA